MVVDRSGECLHKGAEDANGGLAVAWRAKVASMVAVMLVGLSGLSPQPPSGLRVRLSQARPVSTARRWVAAPAVWSAKTAMAVAMALLLRRPVQGRSGLKAASRDDSRIDSAERLMGDG